MLVAHQQATCEKAASNLPRPSRKKSNPVRREEVVAQRVEAPFGATGNRKHPRSVAAGGGYGSPKCGLAVLVCGALHTATSWG